MNKSTQLHKKTPDELITLVNELHAQLQAKEDFITALRQELALARQRHYGRKSEKQIGGEHQLDLFDEAQLPDNTPPLDDEEETTIIVPAHQRKKRGRRPLPKDLPRIQVIHDLSEQEKICTCGCLLTKIGEEKTEQLDIIPATVQVIETIHYKYACKTCEGHVKAALVPKQPIPGSIATSGLLAYVLVSKFKDHLPLYRQESIFKRMGVDVPRNTLSHWVIKCGHLLLPLYQLLVDTITDYDVTYADETKVQVLKEAGRSPQSESYMWCFIGGNPERRAIVYHYNPSRSHTVIETLLDGLHGKLHCDGFSGYDTYATDHEVQLVGCWMHARRKFAELVKATKSKGLAHHAISLIAKLYHVEKQIKMNELTHEQTYAYRQTHAIPILEKFKQCLEKHHTQVLPKSPLGKAIYYCLHQWPKLIRYLEDGRLEIDNGRSERAIKPFVIGRKNWMFSNSVAGAKAAEVIYSLIETCQCHQIEPYAYLRYVLKKIPTMNTVNELETLLPYQIDPKLLSS